MSDIVEGLESIQPDIMGGIQYSDEHERHLGNTGNTNCLSPMPNRVERVLVKIGVGFIYIGCAFQVRSHHGKTEKLCLQSVFKELFGKFEAGNQN